MMRLPRSMQGRLLSLVMATVALVWLTSGLITWFDVRHELDELLDGHLAQAAALLVVQQARELEKGGDDDEDRRVDAPSLHRYAPKATFQVWHEGRLVLRSSNAPSRPMSPLGRGFKTGFRRSTWANRLALASPSCGRCCEAPCGRWPRRCRCWRWPSGGPCDKA
jgi:two-component system, OmpR family, sensor histidine kinase QseC